MMPETPLKELWEIIAAAVIAFFGGTWFTNWQTAKKIKRETQSIAIDDQIKISEFIIKQRDLLEKENMILSEKHKALEEKIRLLDSELVQVRKQLTLFKTLAS